jgi:CheY-like chemotaxis protein
MLQHRSATMFGSREPSKGCVLVVEDEVGVRDSVRLTLEHAGYEVLEAENTKQGIETINAGENPLVVDAVLTDIDMGEGLEAAAYFRTQYPHVSLIVMTGQADGRMPGPSRIKVAILGAGKGGLALIEMFSHLPGVQVVGICDKDFNAPGMKRARELGVPVVEDPMILIAREGTHLIVDVTGDLGMEQVVAEYKRPGAELLGGAAAKLLWTLVQHDAQIQRQLLQSEKVAGIMKDGVTGCVVKPIRDENLLDAVGKAIEKRELNRL